MPQQLINDVAALGNGAWIRLQYIWAAIEPVTGASFYQWDKLDDVVYRCNQAGVRLCVCLQGAPNAYLTIYPPDGSNTTAASNNLPNPTNFANFASALVSRYNGANGYGTVEMVQIENELYDSAINGIANNSARDVLGTRLAECVNTVYPSIVSANANVEIAFCSVRKTPSAALTHIQNWTTNLLTHLTSTIQAWRFDMHYYRDGTFNSDPSTFNADVPSALQEAMTVQNLLNKNGFPFVTMMFGEHGAFIYDDGTGITANLASSGGALSANVAITSLLVASLTSAIPDATPITLDYNGGAPQETGLYTYGMAPAGSTTVQITSNPLGSAATQIAFTPKHAHANSAAIYGATTVVSSLNNDLKYAEYMLNAAQQFPNMYCFHWTMDPTATVNMNVLPPTSTIPKSYTQNINSLYVYTPAYYLVQWYMKNLVKRSQEWEGKVSTSSPWLY